MKYFSNINELWSYCGICPVCSNDKKIYLNLGPDIYFKLLDFDKIKDILKIKFETNTFGKKSPIFKWEINCSNNTYEASCDADYDNIFVKEKPKSIRDLINHIKPIHSLYFYLFSKCDICGSYINTSDVEIKNDYSMDIKSFSLEKEGIYLRETLQKYLITIDYYQNNMNLEELDNNQAGTKNKQINLPYFSLDFSNQEKLISKINTILLLQ